jgi:hypothetical protein
MTSAQYKCPLWAKSRREPCLLCDAAALIAYARLNNLLGYRLGRARFKKIVIYCSDAPRRRILSRFVRSFTYRVVVEGQCADIGVQQRSACTLNRRQR